MTQNDLKPALTCPHCKNSDLSLIAFIFPENIALYKLEFTAPEIIKLKVRSFMEKAREVHLALHFLPNFFRCDKCKTPFRLNKNGREYVPRLNRLTCPKCGFNEVGSMIVNSESVHPPFSSRSKGNMKTYFYGDVLEVNGFKCPACGISFFVDANGKEYEQNF